MRRSKMGYIGMLVLLLVLLAAWGYQKVNGQIPLTGVQPSEGLYIPEESSSSHSNPALIPSPGATQAPLAEATAPPVTEATPTSAGQSLPGGETLLAVGDIATCSQESDDAVANIAQDSPGTVLLLGDIVYERGSASEFSQCFDPSWGEMKSRLKPSPGNHEYKTAGAAGYYDYFGSAAGDDTMGYYSFDVGTWHIIALNSNCEVIPGGCAAGSPQETWLRSDLANHPSHCTLAFWHHPLFSSGEHGNNPEMKPIWDALYTAGVEVVLNGHDHDYERFAPQTPAGEPDPTNGIREFVIGTGGKSLRVITSPKPNSEVRDSSSYGLLKFTLAPDGYTWEFVPVAGESFNDTGQGTCH